MSNDVEMNDVNSPLIQNGTSKDSNVPDVEIKDSKSNVCSIIKQPFTGLSKEELEKFAKDPFWIRLRKILFALFWLIWAGMLVAAVLIVVFSPKCPKRDKLEFWQKKTGYWVDVSVFVDSNGDKVGDFDGLINKLDYIQKQVGAGYIILDPIFTGQYSNNMFGSVESFRELDSLLGDNNLFRKLITETRKRGLEIVLAIDFNSLHNSSSFINTNSTSLMKFDNEMKSWASLDGKPSKRKFKGLDVYSSTPESSSMLDLDLKSEAAIKEIKESVKFWLEFGVRGFLLTNVAFYVENSSAPIIPYKFNNTVIQNDWYSNQSFGTQLFCIQTRDFLREIRGVMDVVAKKTDRSRVMIVEAGKVGFGLFDSNMTDIMLQYLGGPDGPDKIADMIVGREFLRSRGWNFDASEYSKSSVSNYLAMTPENQRKRVALASATSTSLRTTDLLKLAAPFLLPGNPIIYFGSEIGVECNSSMIGSMNMPFHRQGRRFPLEDVVGEWPTKCNHMVMPWDGSGKVFTNASDYSAPDYATINTVQSLTAIGSGPDNLLHLHQKLIKVREEPSLQFGKIEIFQDRRVTSGTYEIFVREAAGFPKIIVAIIKDTVAGTVFSFSSVCAKVTPLVVYPSNRNLPENKEVSAENVFLHVNRKESLHVFKCVA